MDNNELLQKAVVSTALVGAGGGGLLSAKQANKFIDYVFDQSVLLQDARKVRMNEPTIDIDKVNIGQRIMRLATEAVDDGVNASPTFSKISMTTKKIRLDWELSTESLEDNIEGTSLENHVASLMARATANDLEDLAIHGSTTSTDPLLKSFDGWRKLARSGSGGSNAGHVVDAAGAYLNRSLFDKALRNLPNKFLQRRNGLKWYTSSTLVQDYIYSLTTTGTAGILDGTGAPSPGSTLGDALLSGLGGASGGAVGNTGLRPYGVPLWEIPLLEETESGTYSAATGNHGVVELTFPENRIFGIQRNIEVYREFKPKKDTIEFTQYVRCGVQIENGDALVHVKNIKLRSL